MKTKGLIILLIVATALLFASCNADYTGTRFEGDDPGLLSASTKKKLQKIALPDDMCLLVRTDSVCRVKDYQDRLGAEENQMVIQLYSYPLLIKADLDQRSVVMLRGEYSAEYMAIQESYLNDADADMAALRMVHFLCRLHSAANDDLSWFEKVSRNGLTKWIDNIVNGLASITRPYDNFWGKVVLRPFYKLFFWCIDNTHSLTSGFIMMASLFMLVILMFVLFFPESKELYYVLNTIWGANMLVYAVQLLQPNLETVMAISTSYGMDDGTMLRAAYSATHFSSSSWWLVVLVVLFFLSSKCLDQFIGKINDRPENDRLENPVLEPNGTNNPDIDWSFIWNGLFLLAAALLLDMYLVLGITLFFFNNVLRHIIRFAYAEKNS